MHCRMLLWYDQNPHYCKLNIIIIIEPNSLWINKFMSQLISGCNMKYHMCPRGEATILLIVKTQRRSRRLLFNGACAVFSFSVMVVAVIMLSFILSRTLCQTVAGVNRKSCPTLVTTFRPFTTSSPKCGEDSSGGKIIMISVNVQV